MVSRGIEQRPARLGVPPRPAGVVIAVNLRTRGPVWRGSSHVRMVRHSAAAKQYCSFSLAVARHFDTIQNKAANQCQVLECLRVVRTFFSGGGSSPAPLRRSRGGPWQIFSDMDNASIRR